MLTAAMPRGFSLSLRWLPFSPALPAVEVALFVASWAVGLETTCNDIVCLFMSRGADVVVVPGASTENTKGDMKVLHLFSKVQVRYYHVPFRTLSITGALGDDDIGTTR